MFKLTRPYDLMIVNESLGKLSDSRKSIKVLLRLFDDNLTLVSEIKLRDCIINKVLNGKPSYKAESAHGYISFTYMNAYFSQESLIISCREDMNYDY